MSVKQKCSAAVGLMFASSQTGGKTTATDFALHSFAAAAVTLPAVWNADAPHTPLTYSARLVDTPKPNIKILLASLLDPRTTDVFPLPFFSSQRSNAALNAPSYA